MLSWLGMLPESSISISRQLYMKLQIIDVL